MHLPPDWSPRPLPQAGLDSLGAVELRNALTARFAVELPATVTFDYPSVAALAGFVARQLAVSGQRLGGGEWPEEGEASDAYELGSASEAELALAGPPLGGGSLLPADLLTDLVGLGCLYPGASPSPAAANSSSGAGAGLGGWGGERERVVQRCPGAGVSHHHVPAALLPTRPDPLLCIPRIPPGLGGFWAAAAAGASLQRPVPHQRWDPDWCYSADAALGRSYARFAAWAEVRWSLRVLVWLFV